MIGRIRTSFAAKLVALEVGTIVVAVVALAGFLIAARVAQTHELERNVAKSSAEGLRRELSDAGSNATQVSRGLAAFAPFVASFPGTATVRAEARTLTDDQTLAVLDGSGKGLVAYRGGTNSSEVAAGHWDPAAAVAALSGGAAPAQGLVTAQGGRLELDGITVVEKQGSAVGYVLDSIDIEALLHRVTPSGSAIQYSVFYNGRRLATTFGNGAPAAPPDAQAAASQGDTFGLSKVNGTTYASYYTALAGRSGGPQVLLAAEVDDSVFAAQNTNDILVVLFTTTLLGTVLSVAAVVFARRFALRPLRSLGHGAARLGGGDYGTRVEVGGADDFSRLAGNFNQMAAQIQRSTEQLEEQRSRLDAALTSLSAVSRALTTTTAGQAALREAVLDAVVEITGAPLAAMFGGDKGGQPRALAGLTAPEARRLFALPGVAAALEQGGGVTWAEPGRRNGPRLQAVVVPMLYQGRRTGALMALAPAGLDDADLPALTVLASQATVALQNSELFERERETVERLQELDSMKSDFLATIQHELRTPLTAIIGLTDLLEMAWPSWSEEQKLDSLNEVQLAAKGLYDLVETILDYSMLESDRLRLTLMPCRVRDAALTAVDELETAIKRHQMKVKIDIPSGLTAQADARRLAQVARALIDNAIKFSPPGATIRIVGGSEAGRVFMRVADRGIGIEPDDQRRIFERFFQVDNTATRRYGGTGMGLALVDRLVAMHGGKVVVESVPGRGSTFTVHLPAAAASTGANGAGGKAPAKQRPRAASPPLESRRSR